MLIKEYRGRGIGVKFFEEREQWARVLNYEITTFCGVIREESDPDRPGDYVPLDQFWRNRGYRKKGGLTCTMSWKQVGQSQESEQELQFWDKELGAG